MKKIGLAVCYDTKNFGSQLQVLATVKKVEELDCKPEIIRYKKKITPTFIVQTIPRLFNISFVKSKLFGNQKDKALKSKPFYQKQVQQRNQRFNAFVDKYFAPLFSESYGGWETLVAKCKKNYDAFLCGSDQLWLPNNLGSHFYTLEFAPDNKPKIAYATSFGVSQIPDGQKKATAKYLNRFQHLSTRELAGQKYVQSDLKDTFKKIRQELITSDKTVLFVGTPCQVEGLLYYLGKKEREHLLTIDLVCYGVPSPGLYKEWIQDIAQKHGSKVSRVYFRDKKYGYAGVNVKVMLQNGQALEDIVDVKTYTKTMFSKIGLRPSCYKCVYRGRNKMSDFTIGDFWQIGDYSKQMDDDRGTSIVQINTRKGEDFLNDISSEKIKKVHVETLENDDLKSRIHKEDYTFEIPRNRTQFFDDSGRMSYDDLIRKYLPASRKDKMATALKPIIHKMPFSHFFFRTMKKVRMNRRKRK